MNGSIVYKPMTEAEAFALDRFACHLRAVRQEQQLTIADVAERLGRTKLAVGRWERGESRPSDEHLRVWAACLGVPVPDGVRGWTYSASPCGTLAGCQRHKRAREPICGPCQEARRIYNRVWKAAA